ncbi:hypothetical protein B0T22DRAFT_442085 [Podospora appendiculata]|uniref:Uncharacterized protein n=1 Tax=Podospora appendiculata TaxID=314037 RepID=A0AAE0X4J0_9PEZI|nr:hypothetical protein B0T22DRAFT_442085 [Podospora appendiculata]
MSSTTVTCSRKQTLLSSLVSQHVDSDQSSQEQVVSNAQYAFARQEQRAVQLAPYTTQLQGSALNSLHQHQPSIDELATRTQNLLLVASSSMPLDRLSKQIDDIPSHLESSAGINGLNINQKVDLMLAATKSLKPIAQVNAQKSGTTSKMSQIFVRNGPVGLLRKVTNVWKGHLKDSQQQHQQRQQEPNGGGYVPTETLQSLSLPEQASPITSLELRLNEGKNLNRDKVQKMMGGGIQRKPVPEDGNSLRDRKSYEDPFSEAPSRKRPPTKFESRLRENSVDESTMALLPLDKNPFETERILESGIDSILSSAPIASSTPRVRVDRIPAATSESPTRKSRSATRGDVSEEGYDISCNSETPLQGKPKDGSVGLAFSDGVRSNFDVFDEGRALGGVFTYVPVVDNMEMKKHPSPAKGVLERLMKEFRTKYPAVPLGPGADHDTTDELACSPSKLAPITRPLDPVDKSRRFGGYMSLSDNSTAASESLGEPGRDGRPHDAGRRKPVRTMAVVKPVGITRSHTESQFTLHGCPRHIEMDELQMDTPSVTHGYAPLGSQEVY